MNSGPSPKDGDHPPEPTVNTGQVINNATIGGDVNNIGQIVVDRIRRTELLFSELDVERLRRSYVEVIEYEQIRKSLQTDHAVVLTGDEGCGRTTTAVAALASLMLSPRIHRLQRDNDGDYGLKHAIQTERDAYLFPIPPGAEHERDELSGQVERVRELGSYMVVVTDDATAAKLTFDGSRLRVVKVVPPGPLIVYEEHVRGTGVGDAWKDWPGASRLLNEARPGDAARLVRLIKEAQAHHPDDYAKQCEEVEAAYGNWTPELLHWFRKHEGLQDRVLLLTVAALEPVSSEVALRTAAPLANAFKMGEEGGGLAWPSIKEVAPRLKAVDDDGTVTFGRADFGRSVLAYTCDRYPLARDMLLPWLAGLPAKVDMPPATLTRLVETFIELAVRHGRARLVASTVVDWSREGLIKEAVELLGRASIDPSIGVMIRQQMYEWSRTANLDHQLKIAIALACGYLGQVHLSIALTRLMHLASYADDVLGALVVRIADGLADTPDRRHTVCSAALRWADGTDAIWLGSRQFVGAALFLRVGRHMDWDGRPLVLIQDPSVDVETTLPGWVTTLRLRMSSYEEVVQYWLTAAAELPGRRRVIIETLLAASIMARNYARLVGAALQWDRWRSDDRASHAVYVQVTEAILDRQRRWAPRWVRRFGELLIRTFRLRG